MSAEPNKPFPKKDGAFAWREIARHCDDSDKLKFTATKVSEELTIHLEAAERRGLDIYLEAKDAIAVSNGYTAESVEGYQQAILAMVRMLEAIRNDHFRANGIKPPLHWDAYEIARAVLGYDPDIAAHVRDDEL